MNAAAQLARLATVVPPMEVRIFKLDRGFPVWTWLCPKCLERRKSAGWKVHEDKDPPHRGLGCDDCLEGHL